MSLFAASTLATALYMSLAGIFNSVLKPYNVRGELGHSMYTITWLAVAFSFGACLLWSISTCFFPRSNKTSRKKDQEIRTQYD